MRKCTCIIFSAYLNDLIYSTIELRKVSNRLSGSISILFRLRSLFALLRSSISVKYV